MGETNNARAKEGKEKRLKMVDRNGAVGRSVARVIGLARARARAHMFTMPPSSRCRFVQSDSRISMGIERDRRLPRVSQMHKTEISTFGLVYRCVEAEGAKTNGARTVTIRPSAAKNSRFLLYSHVCIRGRACRYMHN